MNSAYEASRILRARSSLARAKDILFKPFPDISEEKGSLRELFKGMTAEEVMEKARETDIRREKIPELAAIR